MFNPLFQVLVDAVFPPRGTEQIVRALAARGEGALTAFMRPVCMEEAAAPFSAVALLPYAQPEVAACVREAKFGGSIRAAQLLGSVLRDFLREYLAESFLWDAEPPCIVPLPLSPGRLKERGYNQAERIVRAAFGAGGQKAAEAVIDTTLLARTRATRPQTSLSARARRKNLAGAFAARACDPHRTYMPVDDVYTTGSTMAAAVAALRQAGARHILPLALAYQARNDTVGNTGDVAEWPKAPHC